MKSDHNERHLVNIVTWMVGGHFLLRLREVNTSEKKSMLKSALQEYLNFWEEAIYSPKREVSEMVFKVIGEISNLSTELLETETSEIRKEWHLYCTYMIACYIAKTLRP